MSNARIENSGLYRQKILIVDDEEIVRSTLSIFLSAAGFECLQASTGKKALQLFEDHRPLIVVLDLVLPDIPGLQIQTQLMERYPEVRIIAISGELENDELSQAKEKEAFNVFQKPLRMAEILSSIESAQDTQLQS